MEQYIADYFWLTWIILGAIAGVIAKAIMPGRDPGGCIVTPLLGIAGALLAGFLGRQLEIFDPQRQDGILTSLVAAVVGALIILAIYRLVARRRY